MLELCKNKSTITKTSKGNYHSMWQSLRLKRWQWTCWYGPIFDFTPFTNFPELKLVHLRRLIGWCFSLLSACLFSSQFMHDWSHNYDLTLLRDTTATNACASTYLHVHIYYTICRWTGAPVPLSLCLVVVLLRFFRFAIWMFEPCCRLIRLADVNFVYHFNPNAISFTLPVEHNSTAVCEDSTKSTTSTCKQLRTVARNTGNWAYAIDNDVDHRPIVTDNIVTSVAWL